MAETIREKIINSVRIFSIDEKHQPTGSRSLACSRQDELKENQS